MKVIDIGSTVVTPEKGRKGVVRAMTTEKTGKRGRPAHVAIVQFRDRGRFVPGTHQFRVRTLWPA